jgi:hypothetical protein
MERKLDANLRQRKKTTPPATADTDASTESRRSSKTSGSNGKRTHGHNRRASYCHAEPPPIFFVITSSRVDAALASIGTGLCLAFLTWASNYLQLPLVGSFLMNTSIKMFFNREPPPLLAFWKSSLFCIPVGTALHFLPVDKAYQSPIIVSAVMFYWKLYGDLWTPANSLAIYIATGSGSWSGLGFDGGYPWLYLLTPYLMGHLVVYAFALFFCKIRTMVRGFLVGREFFANENRMLSGLDNVGRKTRLKDLFDRMDIDGNGRLDVHELQLALRTATGLKDFSLEEARMIMKATDTDGDSTLDFYEFQAAISNLMVT